jgi:hypothetical protein
MVRVIGRGKRGFCRVLCFKVIWVVERVGLKKVSRCESYGYFRLMDVGSWEEI